MLPVIEQLLVLQDRDARRLRIEQELDDLPQQKERIRRQTSDAETALEAARTTARRLESERKALELEASTKQDFIRKLETLQGSTKSNDEYRRYTHQIETTRGEITGIEDRQLDYMEQSEKAARDIAAKMVVAQEQKREQDGRITVLDARIANLEKELAGLNAERDKLAAAIDGPALSRYERIFERRGEHALVGVNGAVCGGCHMKLPQQVFLHAKGAQDLVTCPSCGRLLYYTRDMEPED